MNLSSRKLTFLALGAVALTAWGWQAVRLREAGTLDLVPNIAAIGRSPYGKTLGMAIQGPVDNYWHKGRESHHDHDHAHSHDHDHDHAHGETDGAESTGGKLSFLARAKEYLEEMKGAVIEPNTVYGQSPAHVKYLHRQIERKLEMAYWLDPGNYANFNSLMLFLSEEAVASRDLKLDRVMYFADHTLAYVEKNDKVNPEPWLTAAAAANAKIEWYVRLKDTHPDASPETVATLKEKHAASLKDFERCLNRYQFLRDVQVAANRWESLPLARRVAMDERSLFLRRIFEAQSEIQKIHFTQPATP